jgi:hypothetical protein
MPDNKPEILRIYRLLTPKHRADLWDWVRLAFAAENSVRKSLGFDVLADDVSSLKSQEYFCENLSQRREK